MIVYLQRNSNKITIFKINMKRFFFLLSGILFLNLNSISAQKLFLGPELGVNLSPTLEVGESQAYQLGVNGGLALSYNFNDKIALKSGVYYTQKYQSYDSTAVGSILDNFGGAFGGVIDIEDVLSGVTDLGLSLDVNREYQGTVQGTFIEIPLQIEVKTGRVSFSLGGYAGYMISAESNTTVTENVPLLQVVNLAELLGEAAIFVELLLPPANDSYSETDTSKEGYNSFDYGIKGGMSYISSDNLSFNLSYQHGLRDYRFNRPVDLEETDVNENAFAPFKNVTFTMAYQFPLKKKSDSVFMP